MLLSTVFIFLSSFRNIKTISHENRENQPGPTVHRLPEVFIIISSLVYKPIPLFDFPKKNVKKIIADYILRPSSILNFQHHNVVYLIYFSNLYALNVI